MEGTGKKLMVSARTAAEIMDVSKSTWDRLVSAGKTPSPVKLTSGTVRWRYAELADWAAAGCPERSAWERQKTQAGNN